MDTHGMPLCFFVTDATVADCSVAEALIAKFKAEYLLAARGYDTDAGVQNALKAGMAPVVSPKKNRKVPCEYEIFTSYDTSSKTHFFTSKDGAAAF